MNSKETSMPTGSSGWVRPEVKRLEAGAAESQRGATPDGGGGNQGS